MGENYLKNSILCVDINKNYFYKKLSDIKACALNTLHTAIIYLHECRTGNDGLGVLA